MQLTSQYSGDAPSSDSARTQCSFTSCNESNNAEVYQSDRQYSRQLYIEQWTK